MDFDFSPEQQQLRDQARRCLADHCSSTAVRAVLDGPPSFDAALWRGLGEQGYLGAALPEQLGRVTPASIGCAVSQGRPRGSKCPVADGDIANFANVARAGPCRARPWTAPPC